MVRKVVVQKLVPEGEPKTIEFNESVQYSKILEQAGFPSLFDRETHILMTQNPKGHMDETTISTVAKDGAVLLLVPVVPGPVTGEGGMEA